MTRTLSTLHYRPDWPEARARFAAWWQGEDIGRPAMWVTVPREDPIRAFPELPQPQGWITDYSQSNFAYRVNSALTRPGDYHYLGEAAPSSSPGDIGPNSLAQYLGCTGREMPGTFWCQPCIEDPESYTFTADPDNASWQFSQKAMQEVARQGQGYLLQQFPDLVEGLDTLEAMRGGEALLEDLYDRPEWVHAALDRVTDLYFHYYDAIYDIIKDEVGGSVYWAWAPGRIAKLQCDFSAMISPAMFREFTVPVLTRMTERFDYSIYHWDGPGAIPHLNALLELPRLDMIQWIPGAGEAPPCDATWFPFYHRMLDAGKRVFIVPITAPEQLQPLKREFGKRVKQMYFVASLPSLAEAEECMRMMEC